MTENEFYEALRGLNYKPSIGPATGIIRLRKEHLDLCPITAVAMVRTGQFFETYCYRLAAKNLKLGRDFAEEVAAGSDNRIGHEDHGLATETEIKFWEGSKKARVEIIEALGMEEECTT